jgi:uracil-DNA glycosylase
MLAAHSQPAHPRAARAAGGGLPASSQSSSPLRRGLSRKGAVSWEGSRATPRPSIHCRTSCSRQGELPAAAAEEEGLLFLLQQVVQGSQGVVLLLGQIAAATAATAATAVIPLCRHFLGKHVHVQVKLAAPVVAEGPNMRHVRRQTLCEVPQSSSPRGPG